MKAVCLLGVLVLARILVVAAGLIPLSPWLPFAFLWQDVLFVGCFAVLERGLRRWPWLGWSLYGVLAAYVAVNVPLICELATPLTWPLLRAARGTLADSIRHHVTAVNLLRCGLILAAAVSLPFLLRRRRLGSRGRLVLGFALLLVVLVGWGTSARLDMLGLHRNVFVTLLATAFPRLAARDAVEDWRASPYGSRPVGDLGRWRGRAAGRNVVLIHLESTAAQYLRLHGAAEDPMPTLTALARQALVFDHAYTVFPETIKSFVAVHSAVHPALDTPSERYEHVGVPALGNLLAAHGYRTGLFHSGRFDYLGMDAVVRRRGFATLEDAGAIGGERESSFGIDEESTVKRMLGWLDEAPAARFLLCYLPIAGHHPYAVPNGDSPFGDDTALNRYRNALRYADSALKQLRAGLRQRGLEDDTLFVLCGDHGQAFGQHPGNFGHTLFLYEENVRVPLLFAAPGLFSDTLRSDRVASLVDVAPTIVDLLGLSMPAGRAGRSLLTGPERLALFGTDYSLGLLGLRDGRWKLIHELETGRSRLFDLKRDPGEQHDLAGENAERVDTYVHRLRAWAAAERFRISSELEKDPR